MGTSEKDEGTWSGLPGKDAEGQECPTLAGQNIQPWQSCKQDSKDPWENFKVKSLEYKITS